MKNEKFENKHLQSISDILNDNKRFELDKFENIIDYIIRECPIILKSKVGSLFFNNEKKENISIKIKDIEITFKS